VYLQTAHLDRDSMNNAPENLMALCQYCHLHYDRRDNIRLRRLRALLRTNPIPLFSSEEI
jgi:predicted HNH restriction endonuclease